MLQQQPRSFDSAASSDVQHLYDRNREQAELIKRLKQREGEQVLRLKRERDEQSQYVVSLRRRIKEPEDWEEVRIH